MAANNPKQPRVKQFLTGRQLPLYTQDILAAYLKVEEKIESYTAERQALNTIKDTTTNAIRILSKLNTDCNLKQGPNLIWESSERLVRVNEDLKRLDAENARAEAMLNTFENALVGESVICVKVAKDLDKVVELRDRRKWKGRVYVVPGAEDDEDTMLLKIKNHELMREF